MPNKQPNTNCIARKDEKTGAGFEVIPTLGGILHQLTLTNSAGKSYQLLTKFDSHEELVANPISKSSLLFPFPNRLAGGSYEFEGKTYQFPINEPERNNNLHGFLLRKSLKLKSVEMADDMKVTVSYQYKKEYDYYPFSFELDITYQLDAPDQFSVFVEIKNTGTGNMPFGFGWHPYFCLGEPVKNLSLQFPKVKRVLLNKNIIPTGEKEGYNVFESLSKVGDTILDDCFVLDNPLNETAAITLWSEKQQYGVKVWQEASADKFPFIQIYTPSNDLNYLAIEPMTCSIDAFNNGDGLQVLGAGESFSGKFGVSLI